MGKFRCRRVRVSASKSTKISSSNWPGGHKTNSSFPADQSRSSIFFPSREREQRLLFSPTSLSSLRPARYSVLVAQAEMRSHTEHSGGEPRADHDDTRLRGVSSAIWIW